MHDQSHEGNLKLVDEVSRIAGRKGVTVAQVAIAWVKGLTRSEKAPVVPIPSVSSEKRVEENLKVAGARARALRFRYQIGTTGGTMYMYFLCGRRCTPRYGPGPR